MRTNYETPQDFFDTLDGEFKFTLDACASNCNRKVEKYFSREDDGLSMDWSGNVVWVNPPYDKTGLWMKKAYETAQNGDTVVCLVPGRSSDTVWWHDYVMRSSELRFIKNRLHFGFDGKSARANISSVVVIFNPFCTGPPEVCSVDTKGNKIV